MTVRYIVVGVEVSPGRITPQNKRIIVHQSNDNDDHERQVSYQILSPGFGNIEGDHGRDKEIVGEKEQDIRLKSICQPPCCLVVQYCVVPTTICPIVVTVYLLVNVNYDNLCACLD